MSLSDSFTGSSSLSDDWQLVGSVTFAHPRTDLTIGLFRLLSNRIVKVKTTSSTQHEWRRACYMKQVIDRAEISNHIVPLNQETIFVLSTLPGDYGIVFTPVRWLPDLTVWVWEYTGSKTDILTRIESKIDNLSS